MVETTSRPDVVGLVPAAGVASRIQPIPCSKEILPLGVETGVGGDGPPGTRFAAQPLLVAMGRAGAGRAYVVLRTGKWDIPAFLEGGTDHTPLLAYLVTPGTAGVPFTVDAAVPFLGDSRVVFGFPDILFQPTEALDRLLSRQEEEGADVVLGMFPASRPEKMDMVRIGRDGAVKSVVIKPDETDLRYTWILAVWTPAFTEFVSDWCRVERERRSDPSAGRGRDREPYLGHVIQDGLDHGITVDGVVFEDGSYVDIGTPGELASVMKGGAGPGDRLPDAVSRERSHDERGVGP